MNGVPVRRRRVSYTTVAALAAAILAVYWLGYMRTREAAGEVAGLPRPPGGAVTGGGYRDGTYSATGTGAHGDVSVQVVVRGGRISRASVLRCTTQYPCSDVSPLQAEVIARQDAEVEVVSRATDSSIAYINAVRSALDRAR